MAMFDPTQHTKSADGKSGSAYLEIAGEYLFVATRVKRGRANKSNKPYLLMTYKVISGQHRGKRAMERVYVNDEAQWKLGAMCQAMDYKEAFDLDDDRELREALLNRPFKARVSINRKGDATYPELFFIFKTNVEEDAVMNEWMAEFEASGGDKGGGGFDEDDGPPPHDDGDIPF